jgi:predicted nucleic acid-binding protein
MIALDTNVVSETMRSAPNRDVVDWLNRQDIQTLYLTAVSLAELRFGIAQLANGKVKADLTERLEKMLVLVFEDRILPFTTEAAKAFADGMAAAKRKGRAVGFQDGMIAASIAVKGFTIATRDTAPFEAMDIPFINPFDPA